MKLYKYKSLPHKKELTAEEKEPHKLSIQALEGGAVSDHQALFDAGFEDVVGSQSVFLDFEEDEVCVSWINLISVFLLQLLNHPISL